MSVPNQTAAGRPLPLRARADLQWREQDYGGRRLWVVKDPIALKYFHLREEERAVLSMLDGRLSLDDLRRRWEKQFAPRHVSTIELSGFLASLHRDGLVTAESAGQGEQLLLRHDEQRRRRRVETMMSVLAMRFRGVNPRWFLDWLEPKCRFLFSRTAVFAGLTLMMAAALLVLVQFETFRARLPDARAFLTGPNLPWLLLTVALTKILHELGHAMASRRFGVECHEIGVMLLVFTPCLYCNVSDSWMLRSKWQRMAIAAAGIYVEMVLAAVCVFLWWFSAPGLLNSLCLNVVIVCSVGTLVFNGNPLLRYDGYFVLADWTETPNLGQQATAAARGLAARWFLGMETTVDPLAPADRQLSLALYAVASTVYRWTLVIAILWGLRAMARPYHLEPFVALAAGVVIVGMIWPLGLAVVRLAREPSRRRPIARARAAASALVGAALLAAFAFLPLTMRVTAPVVIEFRDAQRVYVTAPGTLLESARVGQEIGAGDLLARLANRSIEMEVAKLRSERDRQRIFVTDLEARTLQGTIDGAQLPAAKTALADLEQRLDQLELDAKRLTLVAPTAGVVLPPPNLPRKPRSEDKLDVWSGLPFDERNRGCYFETGTLVCLVGDPTKFEAVLHIEQTDIELVDVGQSVRVMLDYLSGEIFEGKIVETAKLDMKEMPRELVASGDLPGRTDDRGVKRPQGTWYQARVRFEHDPPRMLSGAHGRAKVDVAPRSLGWRLVRYLEQTFGRAD